MSTPDVRTESGTQRMPMIARFQSLAVRSLRQRFQRRQQSLPADRKRTHTLPAGQETTAEIEDMKSSSPVFNAAQGKSEQRTLSRVQEASQPGLTVEIDNGAALPANVDSPTSVISLDTAGERGGDVEGRTDADARVVQKLPERPPKSQSSLASTNAVAGERSKLRKPRRGATPGLRSSRDIFFPWKRRRSKTEGAIVSMSTVQLGAPSSTSDDPPRSEALPRKKKVSTTSSVHIVEDIAMQLGAPSLTHDDPPRSERLPRKKKVSTTSSVHIVGDIAMQLGAPSSTHDDPPLSERLPCRKEVSTTASVHIAEAIATQLGVPSSTHDDPPLSERLPCRKEVSTTASVHIAEAIAMQLGVPSSTRDDPPRSERLPRKKKVSTTSSVHIVEGNSPNSADAVKADKTATESEEIEKLRRDLSNSYSQIAELQKRCEAQSRDLENLNSFLHTADKSSDSEVIHALQRLNAEVQQVAMYMADCLEESFGFRNVTTNMTKEQTSAVQRASEHIGMVLVKYFETKPLGDITMLLQIALQAYLASVLCDTASSWSFEPGNNTFISGIYQRLRRVEAQAISGRWRSLARVHIAQNWITHPDSLVKGIIMGIADILLAAGCTAPQSDIIPSITSKFEEKIASLVGLAARLNKTFDGVISSDFEVFVVRPGEKFEGKKMEDTDGGQVGIMQEELVLCATHLGLLKRIPVGTLWDRGRKQKMIALKAKVLLESFLNGG